MLSILLLAAVAVLAFRTTSGGARSSFGGETPHVATLTVLGVLGALFAGVLAVLAVGGAFLASGALTQRARQHRSAAGPAGRPGIGLWAGAGLTAAAGVLAALLL